MLLECVFGKNIESFWGPNKILLRAECIVKVVV